MNRKKQLRYIENDLKGIIAAITQVSGSWVHRLRIIVQITTSFITTALVGTLIVIFISAFGTASTGTPIDQLSGAAATSAIDFWVGSIFGLGAVAGALITLYGTWILGLITSKFVVSFVWGNHRKPEKMKGFEVRALYASHCLVNPLSQYLSDIGQFPTNDELKIFAKEGLLPLCNLIDEHLHCPKEGNKVDAQCQSFEKSLALWQRRKLYRHHRRLSHRAMKLTDLQKSRLHVLRRLFSR